LYEEDDPMCLETQREEMGWTGSLVQPHFHYTHFLFLL